MSAQHPISNTHFPNERLYKTMVTFFVLTFYPPMPCFLPFQIQLRVRSSPQTTLYTLMLIYLIVTLQLQFLNDDTVSAYMLTFPENLRRLHQEISYLHAILHDKNYSQTLHSITAHGKSHTKNKKNIQTTPMAIKQDEEYVNRHSPPLLA